MTSPADLPSLEEMNEGIDAVTDDEFPKFDADEEPNFDPRSVPNAVTGKHGGRPARKKKDSDDKPNELGTVDPHKPPRPEEQTRDALFVWPRLLQFLDKRGYSPEAVGIRIKRVGLPPFQTDAQNLDIVEGSALVGVGNMTPGQYIYEYITERFHMGRRGRAKYLLDVFWKVNSSKMRTMEVILDDPNEIAAQRARATQFESKREGTQPLPPRPIGAPHTPPGWVPQATTPNPAAPGQSLSDMFSAMQQMMGMIGGVYETARQQAMATGQPAPPPIVVQQPAPPPPQPTGPRLTPDEEELIEEGKFRRRAAALGYVPASQIPQAVAQPAQAVGQALSNPIDSLRTSVDQLKQLDRFKKDLAGFLGVDMTPEEEPEEPETPAVPKPAFDLFKIPGAKVGGKEIHFPRNVEGGFLEWGKAFFASNMEVSFDVGVKALGELAQKVDQTTFGKLLTQVAQSNVAAPDGRTAAQAAQLAGKQFVGSGPGLPASGVNGVRPKGPSA